MTQRGIFLSVDRVLGLLAHTMGQLDLAVGHYEDALAICRKGFLAELAWTCCDYADTLFPRNKPGDREKAMHMLDESLTISAELGMRPLADRAQDRLDQLATTETESPGYPDGLSQREVEVLRLLSEGKSNREIGEELVITEGTVRRHVSNIFDKIGVANRTEAARYATLQGLVSSP